jgi:methylglutaconyl-CoA hydratase
MSGETIRLEVDGRGVARLVMARPARHNALNAAMIAEMTESAARLDADDSVRVVAIEGEGESFCAGADLAWMREQIEADAAAREEAARALAGMLGAFWRLGKPLVVRVQGAAYGGGVGLVCLADVAVAAEGARFALTETRLGLIPATIGPYVVARLGPAAGRVVLSGRPFGADEAARLGLLARAVAPEALDRAVEEEVAPFLQCAPGAVREAKALLRALGPVVTEEAVGTSIAALVRRWESAEAAEGTAAFLSRRRPSWQGGEGQGR